MAFNGTITGSIPSGNEIGNKDKVIMDRITYTVNTIKATPTAMPMVAPA